MLKRYPTVSHQSKNNIGIRWPILLRKGKLEEWRMLRKLTRKGLAKRAHQARKSPAKAQKNLKVARADWLKIFQKKTQASRIGHFYQLNSFKMNKKRNGPTTESKEATTTSTLTLPTLGSLQSTFSGQSLILQQASHLLGQTPKP